MKASLLLSYFLTGLLVVLTACGRPDQNAIEASLAWSRMRALPATAEQVETTVMGSTFSREVEVSFYGSRESIETWIEDSPGTRNATVSEVGNISTYEIEPGEGAQFAQVTVNWTALTVTIHAYWS